MSLLNGVYVLTERVDRLVNDPHQAITARTLGQLYNSRSGLGLPKLYKASPSISRRDGRC